MRDTDALLRARLEALGAAFAAALPGRVRDLEHAWSPLHGGLWNAAAYRTAMRLAHGLAGAGATFGHPHVSETAGRVERALQRALDAGRPLDAADREAVAAAIVTLADLADRADDSSSVGTAGQRAE